MPVRTSWPISLATPLNGAAMPKTTSESDTSARTWRYPAMMKTAAVRRAMTRASRRSSTSTSSSIETELPPGAVGLQQPAPDLLHRLMAARSEADGSPDADVEIADAFQHCNQLFRVE